jgi:ketosteroid isomerase-like protein
MHRVATVAVLVSLVGCARVNVEEEQKALMAADQQWAQSTKELDKFMSYVAADANGYPPGSPRLAGADAFRAFMADLMKAPGYSLSWTATNAVVAGSGDIGYTTGTYDLAMAGNTEKGKYVTTWKKQGGSWKVAEDIFNADAAPAAPPSQHVMAAPGGLKWGDPPPSLPSGAKLAVVQGDPSQAQPFVVRLQVPAGYKIAPHWHPGVENVTVLSGTVALGMGEQFDESKMVTAPVGAYASMPPEMRHYFMAKAASVIQVHGQGPFVVNYVNPADDPSKQTK